MAKGSQMDRGMRCRYWTPSVEMLDRYGALLVDEQALELTEQSFADVRSLLTGD